MKQKNIKVIKCSNCEKEFIVPFKSYRKYCSIECGGRRRFNATEVFSPLLYTVINYCNCGCGEIIMNPDNHYRYRKFIYGHNNKNGNHPRLGLKEAEEHIEYRMLSMYKKFHGKVTCIEKQLYDYLDSLVIKYDRQKQIGRTRPDAYIDSLKLCIYVDGYFWHTRPLTIEADKRMNSLLLSKGYSIIRILSEKSGYKVDLSPLRELLSGAKP